MLAYVFASLFYEALNSIYAYWMSIISLFFILENGVKVSVNDFIVKATATALKVLIYRLYI